MRLKLLFVFSFLTSSLSVLAMSSGAPQKRTLIWISLDGLRPDYLNRNKTPFLSQLKRQSVYSEQIEVAFPSITFPTHVSLATGTPVSVHGIPANAFFDKKDLKTHGYPNPQSMLGAEPFWTTAKRQGKRVLVQDWPLSNSQEGPHATDYFNMKFEADLSDSNRLDRLLDAWQKDSLSESLDLLMGYVVGVDSPGHKYGPNAPELNEALSRLDQDLSNFYEKALKIWQAKKKSNEELYFLFTSDHGMSEVQHLVSLSKLTGLDSTPGVVLNSSANIGFVYFLDTLSAEQKETYIQKIEESVKKYSRAMSGYRFNALPKKWGFQHPDRVSDYVVVLNEHYTFSRNIPETIVPVESVGGPLGMHGYAPDQHKNMDALFLLSRAERPISSQNLGKISALEIHDIMAQFMGIKPAETAQKSLLRIRVR